MNELIPRATIEEIVADRNRAVELYHVAFGKIHEASEAMKAAKMATKSFDAPVYTEDRIAEIGAFNDAVKLPDADEFMHVAKRLTDIQFWSWIVEQGDLSSLMDKEAKDKLHEQLKYRPLRRARRGWNEEVTTKEMIDEDEAARSFPPVTVENVEATIASFVEQSGMIFRRGIANAFSKLDRRFRSHDGFKIGSRLILTGVCGRQWGGYSYGSRIGDTLQDIERVFAVLDRIDEDGAVQRGASQGRYFRYAEQAIREAARGHTPKQFEVETDYFKIRCYKNGNGHLWMTRDDLLERVNKLLAEYYGEVVGDARSKDDPLRNTKGPLAKRDFDLFPTPDAVADKVIDKANLSPYRRKDEPPAPRLRVLEPSAGLGNLAIRAVAAGCQVECVEIHPDRAAGLRRLDGVGALYQTDFLRLSPATTGLYDRIIMNPPFRGERDIDHVNHALKFLKPGGRLVAVMSAGTEFRETNKSIAFRENVTKMTGKSWDGNRWNGPFDDLPEGSFKEAGTYVNTILVTVDAPAEAKAKEAA